MTARVCLRLSAPDLELFRRIDEFRRLVTDGYDQTQFEVRVLNALLPYSGADPRFSGVLVEDNNILLCGKRILPEGF